MSDTMCSRCNEKPAAICISCLTDCTESLKQQPPAGEFTKKTRKDFDEFIDNPDWVIQEKLMEACDRLDRAEAINKDLLAALEENYEFTKYAAAVKRTNTDEYLNEFFDKGEVAQKLAIDAIAKAKIEEPK